jgi:hypothetical protein
MSALFKPANQARRGVKWGLAVHSTAMFVFVTILTAANLYSQSISSIDNREFPGSDDGSPPGPFGYQFYTSYYLINLRPGIAFVINGALADGLLASFAFDAIA